MIPIIIIIATNTYTNAKQKAKQNIPEVSIDPLRLALFNEREEPHCPQSKTELLEMELSQSDSLGLNGILCIKVWYW